MIATKQIRKKKLLALHSNYGPALFCIISDKKRNINRKSIFLISTALENAYLFRTIHEHDRQTPHDRHSPRLCRHREAKTNSVYQQEYKI